MVVIDTRSEPDWVVVESACAVWQLTCWPTTEERGSVVVLLTDHAGVIWGAEDDRYRSLGGLATDRTCRPRVWARNDADTLAHELGHVLGLQHVDDPDNVMHISPGTRVNDSQLSRVQMAAHNLAACVGHDPIVK